MCHIRYRLKLFLFCRNVMFHSKVIQFFVFLDIPWSTTSVTSWLHRVNFLIYLLNQNSWSYQTSQLINIRKGNKSQDFFEWFGELGLSSRSYSVTNYVEIQVVHFCEIVPEGQLKMVNTNYYQNGYILLYCHFNKVITMPGTGFQSPIAIHKALTY